MRGLRRYLLCALLGLTWLEAYACLPYRLNGVVSYLAFDGQQCADRSCCSRQYSQSVLAQSALVDNYVNAQTLGDRLDKLIQEQRFGRLPNSPYDRAIERAARMYGVDPLLVKAVIRVESNFDPFAKSSKGAGGLMQLMPETARHYGVWNRFDPEQNIRGGVKLLRDLLRRLKSLELALAAYNAGESAVSRHGGVPPYKETRRYIAAVKGYYQRAIRERETNS